MTNDLADLKLPQLVDQPGAERQADRECRQTRRGGTERDVSGDIEDRERRVKRVQRAIQHQANSAFSRSATTSVRIPREPLTSTRSPAFTSWAARSAARLLFAT